MPQVHPLLTRAKDLCEVFAVRPHQRGFVIWRHRDWTHDRCGWRPDAYTSSRESAEKALLARFPDLAEPEPKAEHPPPAIMSDSFFDFYGGMFP